MSDAKTLPLSADDALAIADKYLVSYEVVQLIAQEALRARLAEPDDEPRRVFIVATGETHNGEETYTRHDDAPPPLCDAECLYTRPSARKVQPLTDEQIKATARDAQIRFCLKSGGSFEEEFARAIERAHGITGDSHD